jgi:hypothetical protein
MESCKTCKYWNGKEKPYENLIGHDENELQEDLAKKLGLCEYPLEFWRVDDSERNPYHIRMFTDDAIDELAILYTRDDHYCSSWKRKVK